MTSAMTLTETILARAAGLPFVAPGDEIWARADRMIMNDSSGPRRIAALVDELGGVLHRDRVVLASDHFAPAASVRHAEILKTTRVWARANQVPAFFEYQGILHNLVLEKWKVLPGMLLVGADSHTVSAGALAAVAVAVGSTELATVLATGEVWLRVPETIRIDLEGALREWVDLRDVTMHLLGALGIQHASYRAIEYGGSFVDELDVEQRMVLSNQGIEMGAKNAIVVPTAKLARAMRDAGIAPEHALAAPDGEARYVERYTFDVGALEPRVAEHPSPDRVRPAASIDQAVDMAWIGSCVGGRGADLRAAARVLAGRKVRVPTLATPATEGVYRRALDDGTLATLVGAGVVINPPGCGACAGVHMGVQGPGDVVIATATRNFKGRMGSPDARVLIGSAYTVAASAIAGRVIDPRELGACDDEGARA